MSSGIKQLWPNGVKIPVIGVTGAHGSGKTTFALSISPQTTLCYDMEKSSVGWEELGVSRIDFADLMLLKYPKGAAPRQAFECWLTLMRGVQAGSFDIIVVDPADRLELGLADWMRHRHAEYGYKSAETFVATKGIFQSYVNDAWEKILLEVASRCQTFVFCNHTKREWSDTLQKSTNKAIPRGRGAFFQLSSLYLWLDREPRKDGTSPKAPSAVVLKDRLNRKTLKGGVLTIQPYLPVRIPVATPDVIRQYILTPADYDNVPEDERAREKELTEDQKMELQLEIAANERATQEAKLEAAKLDAKAMEATRVARERAQSQANEAMMAKEEPARTEIEKPLTDDEALDLLSAAEEINMFDRVIAGIEKMLRSRGVDPAGGNIEKVKQLSRAEFGRFMQGIAAEASAKLRGTK